MSRRSLELILPAAIALIGAAALGVWLHAARVESVKPRLPGEEESVGLAAKPVETGPINTGATIAGPGAPSQLTGSWPQFRGADRTNVVREPGGKLARAWPAGGPRVLWKLPLGEGHAGAAIANGCVYIADYDAEKKEDAVRCLSLDDAREIWRYTYSVKVLRNHGMSRTVPAVNDRFVVSLGPMCQVTCLDARTGKLAWKFDLVKEFGTTVPPWYAGQCPLIDGDAAILAPGGDPLMMSVELSSGRILWRTPNPGHWGMTHSSIMPMDYRGQRQYIYCTTGGVVGVSAGDGKLFWRKPDWKIALAMVPSPLVIDGERVFFSGGYNNGSVMVRIKGDGDSLQTEELFRLKVAVFGADQHTPILCDGHIYGISPPGELVCLDLEGRRLWSSAPVRFGLGPFILADGLLFALNDEDGTLHMAEASPSGYRELASAKLLDGNDAWAPMAIASGRLVLRDLTTMVCIQLPTEAS